MPFLYIGAIIDLINNGCFRFDCFIPLVTTSEIPDHQIIKLEFNSENLDESLK